MSQKVNNRKYAAIALVGEPNVGKSTLINTMIGEKVSIVTHKVQTTRDNVRGILQHKNSQLVFIDTPGIFEPSRTLEKAIVKNAMAALGQADAICVLFDARDLRLGALNKIKKQLSSIKKPCYAIVNKIDLVNRDLVLPLIKELSTMGLFSEIFPISAQKNIGVEKLVGFLAEKANEGQWLFDPEQFTDSNERKLAEEFTREKVFLLLHQELPYSIKVETDKWQENSDGSVTIHHSIFVVKESQKIIVLGKGGQKIKNIGCQARYDISNLLHRKVHLFLFVKVRENWIEKDFSCLQ